MGIWKCNALRYSQVICIQVFRDNVLIWNVSSNFYSWYNRNKTGRGDFNPWFLEIFLPYLKCPFFLSFFLLLLWFFISLLVFSDSTHKCFFPLILSHPRLLFRLLLLSFHNFTADLFDRVVYFHCLYFLTVNSLVNLLQSIFLCPQYFEDSALSESYVDSILDSFTCIISLESSLKSVIHIFPA